MFQNGTALGARYFIASRLIALEKGDENVRPIAILDLIYRVLAKVALKRSFKKEMLLPCQLGINSEFSVEPIIHLTLKINRKEIKGYNYLTKLDFKNAFNSIKRKAVEIAILEYAPAFYRCAK